MPALSRFVHFNQVCSGLAEGSDSFLATRNVNPVRLPWSRIDAQEITPARARFAEASLIFDSILWMPQGYLAKDLTPIRNPDGTITQLLPFDQYALASADSPTRLGFDTLSSTGISIYLGSLRSRRPQGMHPRAFVRRATQSLLNQGFGLAIDSATHDFTSGWTATALLELATRTTLCIEGSLSPSQVSLATSMGIARWMVTDVCIAPRELTGSKVSEDILSSNRETARLCMAIPPARFNQPLRTLQPIVLCRSAATLSWCHDFGCMAASDWNVFDAAGIPLTQWTKP